MTTANFHNELLASSSIDRRAYPTGYKHRDFNHLSNVELNLQHVGWQLPKFQNLGQIREKRSTRQPSSKKQYGEDRLPKICLNLPMGQSQTSKLKEKLLEESSVHQNPRLANFKTEKPCPMNLSEVTGTGKKPISKSVRPRERLEPISYIAYKIESETA